MDPDDGDDLTYNWNFGDGHTHPGATDNHVWVRFREQVPDTDPAMHQCLAAYASDMGFVSTAYLPHRASAERSNIQMASLDHAMWFHRDVRVDDWLLYACDSPNTGGSRGLARGMIYDRTGRLVASTAQEGMIRVTE